MMLKKLLKIPLFFLAFLMVSLHVYSQTKTSTSKTLKKKHVKVAHKVIYKKVYNKASYYMRAFHGRKTANGEFYNKNDFTCAHRWYRFNTLLKITNLKNNRSVIVRVNDRGPYSNKRIVDLSEAAAQSIDMIKRGVISVSVTRVPADSLFQPGILELFSADTTYSLHGTLTNLDGSSIYLWRTYNLGHLIALARSLSDRLPKNELVLRKTKINNLQKYELFMKCKPEESARLLTQMKALGFLRAHR